MTTRTMKWSPSPQRPFRAGPRQTLSSRASPSTPPSPPSPLGLSLSRGEPLGSSAYRPSPRSIPPGRRRHRHRPLADAAALLETLRALRPFAAIPIRRRHLVDTSRDRADAPAASPSVHPPRPGALTRRPDPSSASSARREPAKRSQRSELPLLPDSVLPGDPSPGSQRQRGEGQTPRVPQHVRGLPRRDVPHPTRPVVRRAHHAFAVCGARERGYRAGVTLQRRRCARPSVAPPNTRRTRGLCIAADALSGTSNTRPSTAPA